MKTIAWLSIPILLMNAGQTRVGTDPLTLTRTVGQEHSMVLMVTDSYTVAARTATWRVAPGTPGMVQYVRATPGIQGVVVAPQTDGSVTITLTKEPPALISGQVVELVFKCLAPGTLKFVVTTTATDTSGAAIPTAGESPDTLIIKPAPLRWRLWHK